MYQPPQTRDPSNEPAPPPSRAPLRRAGRWLAFLLTIAPGALASGPGDGQTALRPNIILILADDFGWSDLAGGATNLGHANGFYETPHLDDLAARGLAFTHAYSAGANCAPTRAALLSGQYPPRTGVYNVVSLNRGNRRGGRLRTPLLGAGNREDLVASSFTMAEMLRGAGYATAHVGKYHVGGHEGGEATGPLAQGFDFNYGGNASGNPGNYFADAEGRFGPRVGPELDAYAEPGDHLIDAQTGAALDFITRHKDRPFFLNLAHYAVHTPIRGQGRRDLTERFERKREELHPVDGPDNIDYAALIAGLDESVGRVMRHLEATRDGEGRRLSERTMVVFYSDNGGLEAPAGVTSNGPLRGQKGEFYEGGIRVPLIVWMPGRARAGAVCAAPVTTVDLYATFAELAGATVPESHALDGESLTPLFGDPAARLRRDAIFWHFPGYLMGSGRDARPVSAVRAGDWKLMFFYEDRRYELYNLAQDLGEANEQAERRPAKTRELAALLIEWLGETEAAMPLDAATRQPVPLPDLPRNVRPSI